MSEHKNKHEMVLEIISQVAAITRKLGIVHTNSEDDRLDGRHITIEGKEMVYFGSCGYLGLEHDARLKSGAIEAIEKYGTQFSSSRAYVSSVYYRHAEELLSQMFGGKPVLLLQSLTVGHLSNIPTLVGKDDAVIVDSDAHDSIQTAVQLLRGRNVQVEVIRHNQLEMLEKRINVLKDQYQKIWYLADGVYSMHGDFAPVKELYRLADRYDQLHLYLDDIHGMSWAGPNGTGYVLSQGPHHERLFLTTGLTKAFGSVGGVLVYPDQDSFSLVRNTSKAFIFSIQMPPMVLGATIESAKIHLSPEITILQDQLRKKIEFFNQTAKKLGLPLVNETLSPIGFIGVGKPDVGYNMVRRLMNHGFFINLSVFPSVSYNKTGLRIPINNKLTFSDIELLLNEISVQLPAALEDSKSSMTDIYKSFKLVA